MVPMVYSKTTENENFGRISRNVLAISKHL